MKKLVHSILLTALLFGFPLFLSSQTIVTVPVYPTDLDSTTVIYDATKGNGALAGYTSAIYAHTGVITNLSTSGSDWKYVLAAWNVNLPKALMTSLGNNKYQIILKPSIRAFYGVPAGEVIEKLAFVFRNSDGSIKGAEANGGDIFSDVYPAATSVNIVLPAVKNLFLKQGLSIPIEATSPLADSMSIYVNNTRIKKIKGTTITDTITADNFGSNWIKYYVRISAKNDTAAVADSFAYTVIPSPTMAALPAGTADGINYINDTTVILSLYAPHKTCCFAVGDFNNWQQGEQYYMNETPDSLRYWIQLDHLTPHREYIYQYLADGVLGVGDPYADKVSDPEDANIDPAIYPNLLPYPSGKASGVATIFQTAQTPFAWDTAAFTPPNVTDLVIYELLIRDFTSLHSYQSVSDTLDYLKKLGVNAIELMPVMEFEGNSCWGYNPDFMFAPDKFYGPKDKLKQLVEAAHAHGMAVILDIVLNHQFGESPLARLYWDNANNRPAANSPWFNPIPKHPYNVGNDFNHESDATKSFCERVFKYWLTEYHADGYRLDLSKGYTQKNSYPDSVALWGHYDASRIAILENYNNVMKSVKPNAIVILEHFADNDEETVLSAAGMLLWGNLNYNYSEATEGYTSGTVSDLSWISYKNRGWTDPHVVGYMESHDEERMMFRNISSGNATQTSYNLRDTTLALKRMAEAAAFFYTVPGPKMIWEFGELGYDYSINYPCGNSNCRLDPKPARWDYYRQWRRNYLYNTIAALTDLKKNNEVFKTPNFTMNVTGPLKRINLTGATMDVTVVGNFDVKQGSFNPAFQKTGTWYDYFSGDSITVASISDNMTLKAGEFHLYTTVRLQKPLFTSIDEINPPGTQQTSRSIVYPNPTNGLINLESAFPVQQLELFDLAGHRLRSWKTTDHLDISDLSTGFYLLKITYTDQKTEVVKVSKQ